MRDADLVARIGGEEFAVLVLGAGDGPNPALTRLAEAVAADRSDPANRLAWSVGCVEFDPERHSTVESMPAEADARMYQQKVQRRATGS